MAVLPHPMMRAFGCDLRSLALLRVALGALLLASLLLRLPELFEHYTEAGAWPLAAAREMHPRSWSVFFLGESTSFVVAMFAFASLAALALLIGWRTRLSTAVSFLLLLSLQDRNSLILNGGDGLLRILLFWSLLLPMGARWSIDQRRAAPQAAAPNMLVSVAGVALLAQVASLYVFSALHKEHPCWHADATAIRDALRLETYATSMGRWLLQFPELLRWATHATWWLELAGPLIAFVPWRNAWFRLAATALFMSFHLVLGCTLRIGLFPLVGMAAWLPFLPGALWDRSTRHPERFVSQPIWTQALAGTLLALVLAWNVADCAPDSLPLLRDVTTAALRPFRVLQSWRLFAHPAESEGWYLGAIEADDGLVYDAARGSEIDWSRPADLGASFESVNWRAFLEGLRTGDPTRARWLCGWLRARWESSHPGKKVVRVRLHYLWEFTARRQSPPGNQLVYEEPEGPLTEIMRQMAHGPAHGASGPSRVVTAPD